MVDVLSSTSVRVSWTAIQVTEVTGYRVFYSSTNPSGKKREVTSPSDSPCACSEKDVTVSGPPAVVTGLSPGQSYQFQVQALVEVDGEMLEGERSTSSTVTPNSDITETKDGELRVILAVVHCWKLACVLPWLLVTEDSDCVSTGVLAGAIVATSLLHTAVLVGVVIVTCLWMRRKRSVHRGLL